VALTVPTVLINASEFGLTADLVRNGELRRRGPTVTTLATVSGALMLGLMCVTAPAVATFMGAPEAAPVVQVMSVVVLLGGVGAVPAARLQRDFAQKRQFAVDSTNFLVSTLLTVVLAFAGYGVAALAVGRVGGQVASTSVLFVLAHERPRLGWDRRVARGAVSFGAPLATANVLSWVLLTADNAIIGHWSGAAVLGFYVLAFNVSSWPMSVIGMATRAVALPGFVRVRHQEADGAPGSLGKALRPTALVALPVGALLAVLAEPLVEVLYGERWTAAAAALTGLALFGALRVVLDLFVSFLIAHGGTRAVLWIQVLWLVCLTPCIYIAVVSAGLSGAGWAHLIVAAVVTLPAYLLAVSRYGTVTRVVVASLAPGVGAALVVAAAGWSAMRLGATHPVVALGAGGLAGVIAWLAMVATPLTARHSERPRRGTWTSRHRRPDCFPRTRGAPEVLVCAHPRKPQWLTHSPTYGSSSSRRWNSGNHQRTSLLRPRCSACCPNSTCSGSSRSSARWKIDSTSRSTMTSSVRSCWRLSVR
jgi:lipopolysaccharide exporter